VAPIVQGVGVVARYLERLSPRYQDENLGGTAERVYRLSADGEN